MKALIKYIFITCTVFYLFTSCSEGLKRVAVDEVPAEKLKTDINYHLSSDLIPPELYTITDDLLLLLPYRSSTIIRVYDVNNRKMHSDKIKNYEDQMPVYTDKGLHTTVAFLNKSTNAYVEYELKDSYLQLKRNTSMGDLEPDDAIRIGTDIYINLGDYKEGIFRVLDNKKKTVNAYGNIPFQPNKFHYKLIPSKGYMSMQENDLYFVSQYYGYLSCYRYNNGKLKLKWQRQMTDFNFAERAKHIEPENDNPLGFDGIVAREKNIYTLYTRNFLAEPEKAHHSLLIFDRKGNPVVNFELPSKVKYFTIDEQEKHMYAVIEGTYSSSLVSFRLPLDDSGKFNRVSEKLRTLVEEEINKHLDTGE